MTDKILFVWDFHGTLEKGNVKAVQELINRVMPMFGVDRSISLEKAIELYGLSWIDYCQAVYPEGNLELYQKMKKELQDLQWREHIVEKHIASTDHASEVLRTIKEKGHRNIILSNTSARAIQHFVQLVGLDRYIDNYIALDSHDAPRQQLDVKQEKATRLADYIAGKQFKKIIKIGDRESDISAGQTVGATTYFFRNEFNKGHILSIQPDYETNDLRDILREL